MFFAVVTFALISMLCSSLQIKLLIEEKAIEIKAIKEQAFEVKAIKEQANKENAIEVKANF